jgi:predicted GNAT family acetyltransferase
MTDLPERLFLNPVWHALHTKHREFAVEAGEACRYPADVAPFAAVETASASAMRELALLLAPAEAVWIFAEEYQGVPELKWIETLKCLQMVLPEEVKPPEREVDLVPLSAEDAPAMVALTDVAFPGFFRSRTHAMGSYFGVRLDGRLIAMGGERLKLDGFPEGSFPEGGFPEVSGVCTHPDHRGKGYAASLIWEVVRKHRRDGDVSWLHVGAANRKAIELYLRMGFVTSREVTLHRVARRSE